jgi:hypothetical protein
LFQRWPQARRTHRSANTSDVTSPDSIGDAVCNRVCFMVGNAYREENLDPDLHARHLAEGQFGPFPLRMYLQSARNLMRGWAAPFDSEWNDRSLISSEARERFRRIERLTLIAGARNQVWHRDSMDRMWEWLGRDGNHPADSAKKVFDEYGHLDLLWGQNAYQDIFPTLYSSLGGDD